LTSVGDQRIFRNPTNHYITCVGWGTQNGIDFWIIKNSWGEDWGEDGYFRIKRGINSRGFNTLVLYPLLKRDPSYTINRSTASSTIDEVTDPSNTSNSIMVYTRFSSIFNTSILSSILIYFKLFKIVL